jgi:hypothetical protein
MSGKQNDAKISHNYTGNRVKSEDSRGDTHKKKFKNES